ncbi:MAG: STAS domain-containing protein [Acidimicrobiales bacterium]
MTFLLGGHRTMDDSDHVGTLDQVGDVAIFCPEADLDAYSVSAFRERAAGLCGRPWVIFDLSKTTFIDSVGLGALIGAIRRIRETGGQAIVCAPRPPVGRLLRTVGLNRIVAIEDAVAPTLDQIGAAS